MEEQVKAWRCENGHVLGQVVRNGSGIRQLLLYRKAVGECDPEEVEVIATVEGFVADVKCSICDCIRSWYPGQESLERMIRQLRKLKT